MMCLWILLISGFISTVCANSCREDYKAITCYSGETNLAYMVARQRAREQPLELISCIGCGITDVYSVLDSNVKGLIEISWSNQKIITKNFNKLTDLEEIVMQNITDLTMSENDFNGLNKLRRLKIYSSKLPALPNRFFRYLKKLGEITIVGGGLKNLHPAWFRGMKSLYRLDLSYNLISKLHPDMLVDTNILTNLKLSSNRITSIPKGLFRNLERLEVLDVSSNPLMSVDLDDMFKHPLLTEMKFESIPCYTLEQKIHPYLQLVSANLRIKTCRYGPQNQCLYLIRQDLPDIELKIYTTDETPGQAYKTFWTQSLIEYVPCVEYCSPKLISKDYASDDPENLKTRLDILTKVIKDFGEKKIFTIEGLTALPILQELGGQVEKFIKEHYY